MEAHLTGQCILVTGERLGFAQNFLALSLGAVKTDQQQMQVHSQRVHCHHFFGFCTDQLGQARCKAFVVTHPRVAGAEVPLHTVLCPIVQLRLQCFRRSLRLQAEGIASEVNGVLSIVLRNVKLRSMGGQCVLRIERSSVV